MIVALRGKLVKSSPLYAVLDVGGVYYGVNVPITTAERLPRAGEETLLHTLAVYREDSQTLYGFATEGDRDFFAILVEKVSGIGPKIALNMLSRMSVQALKSAIAAGDVSLLSKCPGIGRKTAERLVLELRGVLGAAGVGETLAAAESGGGIDLYGHNQPSDVPLYTGLSSAEVTDYLLRNQSILLSKLRKTGRNTRDMAQLPGVPQFRTTRRVDGEYTLRVEDAYRHFDDSVGAICDFDRVDYLYEVPLRALYSKACPNLLTAGRSAAGEGYAWDVLRVIPPVIQTGQAAGEAAALAVEMNTDPGKVSIAQLQARLACGGVMIHFDDKLIPDGSTAPAPAAPDLGHI